MNEKDIAEIEWNALTEEEREAILQANEDFFRSQGWIK